MDLLPRATGVMNVTPRDDSRAKEKHMATFTINDDNNITVFASAEEAAQAGDRTAIHFDSQAALAKVSADWPLSRFVEIWNSISGHQQLGPKNGLDPVLR